MVSNQYISKFFDFYLASVYDNNYYTITENNPVLDSLKTIINMQAGGLFKVVGTYIYEENKSLNITLLNDIFSSMEDGGVILTILLNVEILQQFLNLYSSMTFDNEKFAVVDILLEIEELEKIPETSRKGLYQLTKYSYDIDSEDNKQFLTKTENYVNERMPTSLFESSYLAVQMYIRAAKLAGSFETDDIIYNSVGIMYRSGSGYTVMNSNHYVTTSMHIVRFDVNDGKTYTTTKSYFDQIIPQAFNWELTINFGFTCTFPDDLYKGEKTAIPMLRVALIGKFANDLQIISYVTVFEAMVSIINENTIGGYYIRVNFFDSDICSNLIDQYILYGFPTALFSFSTNDECTKRLYNDVAQVPDMLFFQLEQQNGLVCQEYAFFALDHFTFYIPILDVVQSRLYDEIMIVSNENNQMAQYAFEYLKKSYAIIDNKNIFEYNENTTYDNLLNYLLSFNSRVCILFYGTTSGFSLLTEVLIDESLLEPTYHLIIMDPSAETESVEYHDYERVLYYDPIETNLPYLHLKSMLNDEIGELPFINDVAVRLYSAMEIWRNAIDSLPRSKMVAGKKVANLYRGNVINAILKTEIETAEGLVQFSENHYLKRYMNILGHGDDHKLVLSFTGDYTSKVKIYYNEEREDKIKICSLSDPIVNGKYLKTQTIAIVLSLTGPDKRTEQPLFEAIHIGIDYINQNGLLLDYYIIYKLYNAASSDEDYVSILTDLKRKNYKFIFGGYKTSTLEVIGDIFDHADKKLFFLGKSLGKCYGSNTIITHLHPSQIAQAVITKLLSVSFEAFLIRSSSDSYADIILQHLNNKMTGLSLRTTGNIVMINAERSVQIIQRALPSGGYIITIFSNQQDLISFYEAMCRNGMRYPEYKIINSLFDENMKYILNDYECLYGSIVMDSYFESVGEKEHNLIEVPSIASAFNLELHNHIGDLDIRITGSQAAAYDAISFWRAIVIKRNSFDIGNSSNMYHYIVNSPSGVVELDVNNYLLRTIYGGTFDENGEIIIDWLPAATLKAYIYDQYNISEIGYFCDWTDLENKGKKYYANPIFLSFIHENDYGGKSDRYSQLLTDIILSDINKAGGILGRELAAVHLWTTSSKVTQSLRKVIETTKSEVIFGCVTEDCSNELKIFFYDRNELYFYTGRDDGINTQRNVIVSCTSFDQKMIVLKQYLELLQFKYVVLIGDYRNVTNTAKYIVEESLKGTNISLINTIQTSVADLSHLINLIDLLYIHLEAYNLDKIAIIDIFPTGENQVFLNAFNQNKKIGNATALFIMNYDPADLTDEIFSSLNGEFIVTSYSVTKSSTMSNAFSYLMNSNFPNLNEVSELNENIYSSIHEWKEAVEYSTDYTDGEWPSKNYVELSLKNIRYEGPSGNIVIQSNNRASKNVFIYRINNNNIYQVFPKLVKENMIISNQTYGNNIDYLKSQNVFSLSHFYIIIVSIFCVINVIMCICVFCVTINYRKSKIVKNDNFYFLTYSIIALMILALVGIIFVIPPDNKGVCAIRVWLLALSVGLIFSIMFAKAWRINKLFNNKKLEKIEISNMMLLKIIGLILLSQIVYLALWWIIQPSVPILTYTANHSNYLENVYFRQCSTSLAFVIIEFVFVFGMFSYGAKLAWGLREASSEYNNSTSLLSIICVMSIYILYINIYYEIVIFGIIEIPLDFMLSNEADSVMFTRGFGIELGVFLLILLQFGAKVIILITGKRILSSNNTDSFSGTSNDSSNVTDNVRNKALASRGRFEVYPCLIDLAPIVIATVSESDRFFEEKAISRYRKNTLGSSCGSKKSSNYSSSSKIFSSAKAVPKNLQVQISLSNTQLVHESFSNRKATLSPTNKSNLSINKTSPLKITSPKASSKLKNEVSPLNSLK